MAVLNAPAIDIADPLKPLGLGLEFLDTEKRFGARRAVRHTDSKIDQSYQEYNNLRVSTKLSEDYRAIL